MENTWTRRHFLGAAAAAGLELSVSGSRSAGQGRSRVQVCNPLLRTPLSLIIDDSCPVINKAYYWIQQRHEWRLKYEPNSPPDGWEVHYDKLDKMPNAIPAAFAAQWGEWCGAGHTRQIQHDPVSGGGRPDRPGFPGFPPQELKDWLRVTKEIIWKSFDLTPEMLTHTHVVDLKTWKLTEQWEQGEWVDPPVDQLTEYIAAAMQLLKNVGIACEGVTSPGAFGKRKEMAHARAVLDAAIQVNNNLRPFYFLNMEMKDLPEVPIRHADKVKGAAIASIIGCAGDWFGATGYDVSNPDLYIAADLQGGRLPAVLAKEHPAILVGHWPCMYVNDQIGFKALKEVKKRLDAYDPDKTKTIWMKNSEIGHYWMARELSDLSVTDDAGASGCTIRIATKFPADNFTFALHDCMARRVQMSGADLRQVQSQRDFRSGTFRVTDKDTFVAFDLEARDTALALWA